MSEIEVDGNDKFSRIKNISKIKVGGKLLVTKITEDLIKLLSSCLNNNCLYLYNKN